VVRPLKILLWGLVALVSVAILGQLRYFLRVGERHPKP
jgi:hypothetical protein